MKLVLVPASHQTSSIKILVEVVFVQPVQSCCPGATVSNSMLNDDLISNMYKEVKQLNGKKTNYILKCTADAICHCVSFAIAGTRDLTPAV